MSPMRAVIWFFLYLLAGLFLAALVVVPASPVARGKVPAPEALAARNFRTTALMEIRRLQAKAKKKKLTVRHSWIRLRDVSPALKECVIAAEDSGFYHHQGVEWELVQKAFKENIKAHKNVRGASTITQQLAKNLYLSPKKSYLRKFRELLFTWRLERALTKDRILELYLNAAEWGDGVFGAEAAAQAHFGVSAADLTMDEAIALTAVLPSPRRHSPNDNSRWTANRMDWVWRQVEIGRRAREARTR